MEMYNISIYILTEQQGPGATVTRQGSPTFQGSCFSTSVHFEETVEAVGGAGQDMWSWDLPQVIRQRGLSINTKSEKALFSQQVLTEMGPRQSELTASLPNMLSASMMATDPGKLATDLATPPGATTNLPQTMPKVSNQMFQAQS